MTDEEREASRILDMVRVGQSDGITVELIRWCLRITGDLDWRTE